MNYDAFPPRSPYGANLKILYYKTNPDN